MGIVREETNGIKYYMHNRHEHNMAHLHVHYSGEVVKITIRSQRVIEGSIPETQLSEAQAWIRSKRNRLLKMYKRRMEPGAIRIIAD